MQNPIMQALGQRNLSNIQMNPQMSNMLSSIKQAMNMVRSANNPMSMIQSMAMQNPQLQNVMQYANAFNGSPRQAFYSLAQQKGVNPNEILNLFK